jgi:hypothetical protein
MTHGDAADVIDNSDQVNDAAESHAAKLMHERSVPRTISRKVSSLSTLRASVQLSCSERDRSLPPKLTDGGPLSRSAAVGVLSYAQRSLFAYRLSSDEMISRNKSPRLGRLSVLLRTSLPRHSGYAGGQVFIKHASGPGAHPVD